MNFINDITTSILPETILTLFIILTAILSFTQRKEKQDIAFYVSLIGVVLATISLFVADFKSESVAFFGIVVSNYFTFLFKLIILAGTFFTLLLSRDYARGFGKFTGEYYFLILTATLGAMLLCGANDLVMLFVGLETLSISSFILCGYTKGDWLSNEAGLKYLIYGAVASAVMLYGFSFIYGITGQTNFGLIAANLSSYELNSLLVMAILFTLAGFGFKVSAVPFHAWAPDVYQGAPVPIAAYLSVVSKAAGFAILIRFINLLLPNAAIISIILTTIAVITMTVGNLMALGQQNIRRLMAYSSIAHAGYVLLGVAVLTNDGVTAAIFYLVTYLFMNFGVWAAIELFALVTGKDSIDNFNGLAYKHKSFAFALAVCLLSLAGIPITAGFFSKFYLFKAVAVAGYAYLPVLLIALANTVVALFYYMRIIKAMYILPEDEIRRTGIFRVSPPLKVVMAVCVAAVVLIGVFATPFIEKSKVSSSFVVSSRISVP